jgi:hypothetical protein
MFRVPPFKEVCIPSRLKTVKNSADNLPGSLNDQAVFHGEFCTVFGLENFQQIFKQILIL